MDTFKTALMHTGGFTVDTKRAFGEQKGEIWIKNPTKNSIPSIIEHQPQVKGVHKRGTIICEPPMPSTFCKRK